MIGSNTNILARREVAIYAVGRYITAFDDSLPLRKFNTEAATKLTDQILLLVREGLSVEDSIDIVFASFRGHITNGGLF